MEFPELFVKVLGMLVEGLTEWLFQLSILWFPGDKNLLTSSIIRRKRSTELTILNFILVVFVKSQYEEI